MFIRKAVMTTAIATVLASAGFVPAQAATPTDNFGQHVRVCAQTMGFSGSHNPGMHFGAAGWDGEPCM